MTTPPLHPIQAEFMRLYPPNVYFAMSPDAQAMAWANFVQAKQLHVQRADSRDLMQAWLVAIRLDSLDHWTHPVHRVGGKSGLVAGAIGAFTSL